MRRLALLLLALPAQAQMYKCKDARGVTRYSDKPQADCPGQEVDIRAQPPISGKLDDYGSDANAAERDFQKLRIEREREERSQAQADAARRQRCAQMRAEYEQFANARRVYAVDAKGERNAMDDADRDARGAQMKAQIARECP